MDEINSSTNVNNNNNNHDVESNLISDDVMPLTFKNVFIKMKYANKDILKDIDGYATPGRLLAVMGGTGAGKTSLLSFLAHRLDSNLDYYGKMRYGGLKYSKSLRKYLAFVQQDDIVIPQLTVKEHIRYCARLRLGDVEADGLSYEEGINKRMLAAHFA